MSADDDNQVLAAEYVLGTLDDTERAQAEALMLVDIGFVSLVHKWERRLGELHAMIEPVQPPAELWSKIRAKLPGVMPEGPLRLPDVAERASTQLTAPERPAVQVVDRGRRWRGIALMTGALAAGLALFVSLRELRPDLLPGMLRPASAPQAGLVAVLQRDGSPGFLLTVDLDARRFALRRTGAEQPAGQDYELWLVSDRLQQPRSLGIVGPGDVTSRANLESYDAQTLRNATYAISVEPQGGSPTGVPTGAVVFTGKLAQSSDVPRMQAPARPRPPDPNL